MSLSPGHRLGPYEIVAAIGAGGMGEVYRAKDARLDREVAIKVLPASVAGDTERLARFEREAKAVAALSHPNILAIFDVGTERATGGTETVVAYAVTELLEGETLRARIDGGALAPRKAIDCAVQLARGLAAAHDKGLVHRDLKPENVFLLRDGQVKILDFGLARQMVAPTGAGVSQTVAAVTDPGTVLGTVGYMAPEQVRGQAVDGRSDLFALGAVLYEMLAGRRAFAGDTAADTMTAILKEDPPELAGSRVEISPALDRIIRHCLEKNPAERFQSARDVAFALDALSGSNVSAGAAIAVGSARATRPRALLIAATVAAALVTGWLAGSLGGRPEPTTGARAADVTYQPVTFDEGFVFAARFAQDGRTIVFSADWEQQARDVFVTSVDSPESRPLGLTGADLVGLSPSGDLAILEKSVITSGNPYRRTGTLARASLTGGAARPEVDGVAFADVARDGRMAIVRIEGDKSVLEYPAGHVLDEQPGFFAPRVSPDGTHVAVFSGDPQRYGGAGFRVKIFERSGAVVAESRPFTDWWSLAWTPDGEVWFSATEVEGYQVALFGLDLSGRERLVFRTPGSITVHDISGQGDLLASFDQNRQRVELLEAAGGGGCAGLVVERGGGPGGPFEQPRAFVRPAWRQRWSQRLGLHVARRRADAREDLRRHGARD
ncbi:MAG: protein kinase domain-containing protein [Acidobacteriota bacterium]